MCGGIFDLDDNVAVIGVLADDVVGALLLLEAADTAGSLPVGVGGGMLDDNLAVVGVALDETLGVQGTHDTADTADLQTVGADVGLVDAVGAPCSGVKGTCDTGNHYISTGGLGSALVEGDGAEVLALVDQGSEVAAAHDTAVHHVLGVLKAEFEFG